MPIDLKIIEAGPSGALFGAIWPSPDPVSGEYNLVQRVTKNLLTDPGDDEFYPEYGAGLRSRLQGIPGQDDKAARQAVTTALQKCFADVRADMGTSSDAAERISGLTLDSLEYDYNLAAWRIVVTLTTEAGTNVDLPLALE